MRIAEWADGEMEIEVLCDGGDILAKGGVNLRLVYAALLEGGPNGGITIRVS